jgi:CheY-like chemotaxis protein
MAGGVAHDFNNILQAILGNAQLALMEIDEDSPAHEMLEQIAASGQRAAHLARQMLDYAGESSPVIADTDLRDVVDETLSMIRVSVPPSIALYLDFEDDLPPVRGDRMQLIQVAMNLIVNASEAMGDAPGEITIRVARESCPPGTLRDASPPREEGGEFVVLEVRDTGPGIDRETRVRLFDPFFTTKFTGRGLGLSTVFGIVRGHDAAIRIDSQPGEGAAFCVYFPVSEPTTDASDSARSGRRAGLEPGQRVLVVDDEPAVLAICRRVLERMGCEPVVARSGDEALAQPEVAGALACALIDLTLPGMPATQIMARLRDLHPDLHIIMMSGYSEEDARGQLDAQAFDHYLQKPFDIEHLRNALVDPGTDPRRRRVA